MMIPETGQIEPRTTTTTTPTTTTAAAADDTSGGGGFSEDERGRIDDGGRSSGGNRWPRQETLALLKIRSDMDIAFRDSSLKGPLWDEVSRKLAELGFHRSGKKCKEKFENVYKYHKRTKEGRTSKADGKTYRFFDQLQALEGGAAAAAGSHRQPSLSLPPPLLQPQQMQAQVVSRPPQVSPMPHSQIPSLVSVQSVQSIPISHQNNVDPISVAAPAVAMPTMNINHAGGGYPFSQLNLSVSTNSSDSSTSSDDDEPPERRRSRKRKWKEFFGKVMKEVIDKQEELQTKFIETLERRERERVAREEAWRMQEMAKMKREHELLVQERSMVAAKDAAVITFLQKISEQNPNSGIPQMPAMQLLAQQQQQMQQQQKQQNLPLSHPPPPQSTTSVHQQPQPQPQPQQQPQQLTPPLAAPVPVPIPVQPVSIPVPIPAVHQPSVKNLDSDGGGSGVVGDNMLQPSPSRWPKAEINALIRLRTTLDTKYLENGPKGPLWEEISSAMRKIGYNRNAKRCKEKWENINKYYKKVKESCKKRPEDSKTCPYFHQLDAIYREKAGSSSVTKPETTQMAPIMARPEQQWPLPAVTQHDQQQQTTKTNETTRVQGNVNADDDEYDDDEEEDDEEEEGNEYEIVQNKTSSMASIQ